MPSLSRKASNFGGGCAPGPLANLTDQLRTLGKNLFDSYRPELHYMRGPGPKWHAKHGSAAQDAGAISAGMHRATA